MYISSQTHVLANSTEFSFQDIIQIPLMHVQQMNLIKAGDAVP